MGVIVAKPIMAAKEQQPLVAFLAIPYVALDPSFPSLGCAIPPPTSKHPLSLKEKKKIFFLA